jgi:hypothetical protein
MSVALVEAIVMRGTMILRHSAAHLKRNHLGLMLYFDQYYATNIGDFAKTYGMIIFSALI